MIRYGLEGLGLEPPGGGKIFPARPGRPCCPPRALYNGYCVFPRG